jgi:hypothetical protein
VIDEAAFRSAVEKQAEAIAEARERVQGLDRASRGVSEGMHDWNTNLTSLGYALQDFLSTSGDLGQKLNSITNNLPQILAGFGALGQAAAIATTILVTLYRNWDELVRAFEDKKPFEGQAENVEVLKDRLTDAKKEMTDLAKLGSLTADEQDRYNRLLTTTADLQKRINEETERRQRIQKALEAPAPEQAARAQANVAAVAGQGPEVLQAIEDAERRRAEFAVQRSYAVMARTIGEAVDRGVSPEEHERIAKEAMAKHQENVKSINRDIDKLAERTFDQFLKGDEMATQVVQDLLSGQYGAFGLTDVVKKIREKDPAAVARKKAEETTQKQAAEFDAEAERIYRQQVEEQARRFGQGDVQRRAREAIRGQVGAGATDEQIRAQMQAGLAGQLVQGGANRITAPDVATRLIGDLTRDVRQNLGRDAQKIGEELTRQGEQNQRAGEQEARRQEQEAQAQARKSGAPYVPFAERALVELQAQGGVFDPRRGRVQPLNADQQQAFVARQAAQAVQARNPQMAPGMARDIGGRIAGMAAASLGKRQAQLTAQGVGHTDALMMITATLNNEQARLQQQLMRQGAQIQALGANVQARTKPAGRGPGRR